MSTTETFSGLSGAGDLVFNDSGVVERLRIDITNTGQGNKVDQSTTFPRWFKLGWWVFNDNTFGLGVAALSPIYFIEFESNWWLPTDGVNFYSGGFHGMHYNLFSGVVATINVRET